MTASKIFIMFHCISMYEEISRKCRALKVMYILENGLAMQKSRV